ncbi:response regulator transcription factor [Serratia sp. UGAL515B_01]|uniref:helix-turn-helix transcriptional regulator n=1 Tax=Serratia sp. UGAL515B_01 TaxID=2986763 RepID=UPI00295588A1|nr:response regulator transcription factor [Serratia sp. UGAL515B_01]WON77737.1 response regulator transcription factor [Serratia sp. UGAL515B_01]
MENKLPKINIVISAQAPLTRLGMKTVTSLSVPDARIYSDIDSINQALFTVLEVSADLLLTDMYNGKNMQEQNAALLLTMCQHHPRLKVIIYSRFLTSEVHTLLQHCPQVSILPHEAPLKEMHQAIAITLNGGRYYHPAVIPDQQNVIKEVMRLNQVLTHGERRVLLLLLNGQSQRQIAHSLSRSIKTISTQKCSAMKKLGLKNNSELVSKKDELLNLL